MQQDNGISTYELLSPINDYVFKRIFGESPDLLLNLINDLTYDLPKIASVEILNPNIEPSELQGKYIVLDVLARDSDGNCYNVEMIQVKFDAIPTWAVDLIRLADSNQIDLWVESIMTADSLETLLGHD